MGDVREGEEQVEDVGNGRERRKRFKYIIDRSLTTCQSGIVVGVHNEAL